MSRTDFDLILTSDAKVDPEILPEPRIVSYSDSYIAPELDSDTPLVLPEIPPDAVDNVAEPDSPHSQVDLDGFADELDDTGDDETTKMILALGQALPRIESELLIPNNYTIRSFARLTQPAISRGRMAKLLQNRSAPSDAELRGIAHAIDIVVAESRGRRANSPAIDFDKPYPLGLPNMITPYRVPLQRKPV